MLGTIDFLVTLVVLAICGIAWGFAGFPHWGELVTGVSLTVVVVGGLLLISRWHLRD